MKKEIMDMFVHYVNVVSRTVQYDGWPDDFCRGYINEKTMDFLSALRKMFDFQSLTKEDAISLGFALWSRYTPEDPTNSVLYASYHPNWNGSN